MHPKQNGGEERWRWWQWPPKSEGKIRVSPRHPSGECESRFLFAATHTPDNGMNRGKNTACTTFTRGDGGGGGVGGVISPYKTTFSTYHQNRPNT